ncbi:hypothetical protein [Novosphingobium sp. SG707]|uniref:hypothetical protein n=1 Tax=Novosphingobium sp. SG707 TaxID=2586996 RepID=UPI00144593D7|nr:hypothetical protein [Novosphingobium sp. SG707]NKI98945.1 hypothetical protein [Novosphingobium sp. SG707]
MASSANEWLLYTEQAEALVEADDPVAIASLETKFGIDQQTAVSHLIESTDWGAENFPQFQGGQGKFLERLAALRARWSDWKEA